MMFLDTTSRGNSRPCTTAGTHSQPSIPTSAATPGNTLLPSITQAQASISNEAISRDPVTPVRAHQRISRRFRRSRRSRAIPPTLRRHATLPEPQYDASHSRWSREYDLQPSLFSEPADEAPSPDAFVASHIYNQDDLEPHSEGQLLEDDDDDDDLPRLPPRSATTVSSSPGNLASPHYIPAHSSSSVPYTSCAELPQHELPQENSDAVQEQLEQYEDSFMDTDELQDEYQEYVLYTHGMEGASNFYSWHSMRIENPVYGHRSFFSANRRSSSDETGDEEGPPPIGTP